MNEGDLPLMFSCVFWCEFIGLVEFFGCYCVTPVTLFTIRTFGAWATCGKRKKNTRLARKPLC